MRSADQIVDALLGDQEDPKKFLDRNKDISADILLFDKLREQRVDPSIVDGVEVFGMREEPDGNAYRVDVGDAPATFWTVTIHTTDPQNWMVDFDDYNSPEEARTVANKVIAQLHEKFPENEIHLVDDIV